jgi:SnoaL-like domain
MPPAAFTPAQQAMVDAWEKHVQDALDARSVPATMDTLFEHLVILNVPLLTGGVGYRAVQDYYARHFTPSNPPDTTITLLSRTVGRERLVDELLTFTHSTELAWLAPGIAPTGGRVELPLVAVVRFRDALIASAHLYWDQASVLVQLAVLERGRLPVAGAESAGKLLDPASVPSNQLIGGRTSARPTASRHPGRRGRERPCRGAVLVRAQVSGRGAGDRTGGSGSGGGAAVAAASSSCHQLTSCQAPAFQPIRRYTPTGSKASARCRPTLASFGSVMPAQTTRTCCRRRRPSSSVYSRRPTPAR